VGALRCGVAVEPGALVGEKLPTLERAPSPWRRSPELWELGLENSDSQMSCALFASNFLQILFFFRKWGDDFCCPVGTEILLTPVETFAFVDHQIGRGVLCKKTSSNSDMEYIIQKIIWSISICRILIKLHKL
jgi:hypothetical protein